MDMKPLGDRLLEAGAPVLKSIVESAIGGIGGKLAGAAIDALAQALNAEASPSAIVEAIEKNPVTGASAVREIEGEFSSELARLAEAQRDVLRGYQQVLLTDARSEGWLARRWRPIFALAFTFCFVMIAVTVCRGIWIGQLNGVDAVTGLLITMLAAGCAVLGVQIWQRSEEKKAGVV